MLVALSGGVDSSVVACLLKAHGHDVVGVHLSLWQDPRAPACAKILPSKCCTAQALHRAKSVARLLGIPFHIVSLKREFKRVVVDPFVAAYARGITPNPCVLCNPTFKFAHLLKLAKKWKCDKIATGHYARLKEKTDARGRKYTALLVANDSRKDQSYYLYRLSDSERLHSLFPLGTLKKSAVYVLAKKWKIPLDRANYRESQNLCFFPEKDALPFLRRYVRGNHSGPIKTREGKTVGMHAGLPFYTIGQRRGLRIGGLTIPLYVVAKHSRHNVLVVAPRGELRSDSITITQLHWIGPAPAERRKIPLDVRIRSLGERIGGTLVRTGKRAIFHFAKSTFDGIAPGQSAVLYRREEIVGGGIIT
ncbi:MAG: tRNA 2-thiouridine(34) synthase MnmA [Candidatus Peribacteraceae bacterium]|nr:tRNA 2-thiouridine(34) synthase MnmA [Candidatus Peribacteraceae bacterium]